MKPMGLLGTILGTILGLKPETLNSLGGYYLCQVMSPHRSLQMS